MDDLISRQATIDAVNNAFDRETLLTLFVRSIAVRAIRDMPSAQPEKRMEERAETHACDCISRQAALDAVDAIGHIATMPDGDKCIRKSAVKYTLSMLPPTQPEYEPVTAEDFAKTMSETSVYSYMLWYSEALTLMKKQGFVICKKTM